MLKSIPTIYNGIQYRSRLEARWAFLFEKEHIQFEYEDVIGISEESRYVPDFYLPKFDLYVEVKGSNQYLEQCLGKMVSFVRSENKPILIIGNFPTHEQIDYAVNYSLFPMYGMIATKEIFKRFYDEEHWKGWAEENEIFAEPKNVEIFDGIDDVLCFPVYFDDYDEPKFIAAEPWGEEKFSISCDWQTFDSFGSLSPIWYSAFTEAIEYVFKQGFSYVSST